jgi:hypothetical protein
VSVTESTRGNLMAGLSQDLKELGKTVGPCQSMGLMTGGGLPHGNFATSMRAVPGVKDIIEQIYRQDGRYVDGAIYGLTRQAILLSRSDQRNLSPSSTDSIAPASTVEVYPDRCADIARAYDRRGCSGFCYGARKSVLMEAGYQGRMDFHINNENNTRRKQESNRE